jgi:hypothetical protein
MVLLLKRKKSKKSTQRKHIAFEVNREKKRMDALEKEARRHPLDYRSKQEYAPKSYRDGAEGFIAWCEDKVCLPVYQVGETVPTYYQLKDLPEEVHTDTGKSWKSIWEHQKDVCREALRMKNGRFIYRLIVLCWQRGEGKSLVIVLIQLWKFFNFENQKIMLGANSKDQVKFVHYDIMREVVINSPKLLSAIGGKKNVKEKEIVRKNPDGSDNCVIRSISSFTGIVSNVTGYTFSEMFDMKNPRFFVQLDGSIRNIPNALGTIDSTVSAKTHVLYQLYTGYISGKLKTVYFDYRFSRTGDPDDYWNPLQTKEQLDDYRNKFPFGEFERYFLNLWSAGIQSVFSDEMIEEMNIIGIDGQILNHQSIQEALKKKSEILISVEDMKKDRAKAAPGVEEEALARIQQIYDRIRPLEELYSLKTQHNVPNEFYIDYLFTLEEFFDTHFALLSGIDMGDPYAQKGKARSILTLVLKGLPGSRTNPKIALAQADPKYLYFLIELQNIVSHSVDDIKKRLDVVHEQFMGINTLCSERFGAWDLDKWCQERDIAFEPIYPSYTNQRSAFKVLLEIIRDGQFKAPPIAVPGSKKDDLFREELSIFNHDSGKKWFGSPEKMEKFGIQDDSIFSVGWCIYGGRQLSIEDFRIRRTSMSFGTAMYSGDLLGKYK